jgi:dihydroorotate dehydrogenase (fumarate)
MLGASKTVSSAVPAPMTVKLSPYFNGRSILVRKLVESGAKGLSPFNRFYAGRLRCRGQRGSILIQSELACEIRFPLPWIAVLFERRHCSLAATTGVFSSLEVVSYLIAGADAVLTASLLLKHVEALIATLLADQ